jgi:hypothetical protein
MLGIIGEGMMLWGLMSVFTMVPGLWDREAEGSQRRCPRVSACSWPFSCIREVSWVAVHIEDTGYAGDTIDDRAAWVLKREMEEKGKKGGEEHSSGPGPKQMISVQSTDCMAT